MLIVVCGIGKMKGDKHSDLSKAVNPNGFHSWRILTV